MNSPRYQTRFSNGFWKTFDTHTYTSIRVHYTQADAVIAAARFNTPKAAK